MAEMSLVNFEFKARTDNIEQLEQRLKELNPEFKGEDEQTDTYFNVENGRLKLREGKIENALIYYIRADSASAKQSEIILYKYDPSGTLKELLVRSLGVRAVVTKKRRIYFIGNVKFHFDTVVGLGNFVEVEAIDETGQRSIDNLKNQCHKYFMYFGLRESDFISKSYSDMILDINRQ